MIWLFPPPTPLSPSKLYGRHTGRPRKRDKLLMVPHNTVIAATPEKNVIKVATKQHKDKLYFKREGIDDANVIEGKRTRTKV